MSNTVIYRRPSANTTLTGTSDNARGVKPADYEGVVVDVILDHTHPEYSRVDGYNVGTIKVRIFDVNHGLDDNQLPYAYPLDNTIAHYPLIGELVMLKKVLGSYFYTNKVSIARRIQENVLVGLNSTLNSQASRNVSTAINTQTESQAQSHTFGRYFKPDSRVRQLKHFEGDTIIQGRMGHSIRFGSSQLDPSSDSLAPNIILRTGQGANIENEASSITTVFGLILEDINKDASSIWMTSDQVVPFLPATINTTSYVRSLSNPPQKFDKAQIIINSDRVVLNSKQNDILLFANREIYLNSKSNVAIDASRNIKLAANITISNKALAQIESVVGGNFNVNAAGTVNINSAVATSFLSKKIYIGSCPEPLDVITATTNAIDIAGNPPDSFLDADLASLGLDLSNIALRTANSEREPLVCGVRLAEWLDEVLDVLVNSAILGVSSSGPVRIHPVVKLKLQQAKNKLITPVIDLKPRKGSKFENAMFNSLDNYVSYENDRPATLGIAAQVGLKLSDFVISQQDDEPEKPNQSWQISNSDYRIT